MGLLKGIWIEDRTREVHLTQISVVPRRLAPRNEAPRELVVQLVATGKTGGANALYLQCF